ncbi:ABC transporter substrate-binding protein [Rhizobium leguminosarum]|nr:ABC transporter substrate-binding protein [Rhizobium leguminosarum]
MNRVLRKILLAATAALISSAPVYAADVTVRVLHVDPSPKTAEFYSDIVQRFQASHPGVAVEFQYLENESYKKKLTTLLQSEDRPNIIYSWGGGVLREQVKAGVIEDLSQSTKGWTELFTQATLDTYSLDGKLYGVPNRVQVSGFYYNKDLFLKAGVDGSQIKTWPQFLDAVTKLKQAGIQPLVLGGSDKWPASLYWGNLIVRVGGKAGYEASLKGENGGFASPVYVQAAQKFKELVDLEPFQRGWLGVTNSLTAGQFGDGKAAMILSVNSFLNTMAVNSVDKVGVPDEKLGWFPFPIIEGGAGSKDMLGNLNAWLVTKGSPKEAVDFLKFYSEAANQSPAAAKGLFIPATTGAQAALTRPLLKDTLAVLNEAQFYQISYDQVLGPQAGTVFNDLSVELAAGRLAPEEAAAKLQKAWERASGR